MSPRRLLLVPTLLLLAAVVACDEEDPNAEPELEPVSEALRTEALDAADAAEAAGRPAREAWDQAVRGLDPSVGNECPPEALSAPRRERFVMARSRRFSSDLEPRILELVEGAYGRTVPILGHAERIRTFLTRDDAARLRDALAEEVPEAPREATAVFVVDTLRTPQAIGRDTFRSGELIGTAYLLDPNLNPVCAMPIDSTNASFISSEIIAGLNSFDARALMQLFEHAQTYIDREWDPERAPEPDEEAPAAE